MERPSLIMRWMRPANWVGSSRLKPDVKSEVSKSSQIKSFTVLSDLSAAAFFLCWICLQKTVSELLQTLIWVQFLLVSFLFGAIWPAMNTQSHPIEPIELIEPIEPIEPIRRWWSCSTINSLEIHCILSQIDSSRTRKSDFPIFF